MGSLRFLSLKEKCYIVEKICKTTRFKTHHTWRSFWDPAILQVSTTLYYNMHMICVLSAPPGLSIYSVSGALWFNHYQENKVLPQQRLSVWLHINQEFSQRKSICLVRKHLFTQEYATSKLKQLVALSYLWFNTYSQIS